MDIIISTLDFTPSLDVQEERHEFSNADHSIAIGNIFRSFDIVGKITRYSEAGKFDHVRKYIRVYNWSSISDKGFEEDDINNFSYYGSGHAC